MEVVDPGFDTLQLMQAIDPGFEIRSAALEGFSTPRFLAARHAGCGLSLSDLSPMSAQALWEIHDHAVEKAGSRAIQNEQHADEASLLELKILIARRLLSNCTLCSRRCGVDRLAGGEGVCGLGAEALVGEHFTHLAEEAPVNPSYLISLTGCGLQCRFCQQYRLLYLGAGAAQALTPAMWSELDMAGARSLSFAGGNPDESLYGILRFLFAAPAGWKLPVVWNTNAFCPPETIRLLDRVVDAFIPDFKFGSRRCADNLANAFDYPAVAKAAIQEMVSQGVPVILRVLVLPGHVDCCHLPALAAIASMKAKNLWVSVRGQYAPAWRIGPADGILMRRPNREEVEVVRAYAVAAGLNLID